MNAMMWSARSSTELNSPRPQQAALEDGEEQLDLVEPGGVRRREVQMDVTVLGQELRHRRRPAGGRLHRAYWSDCCARGRAAALWRVGPVRSGGRRATREHRRTRASASSFG